MKRWPALALAAALVAAGVALTIVAVRGPSPPASMDDRVRQVASTLRCPVCQDLSVADSPSLAAREFRAAIERRLRAGESPRQIRDFFVSRYGESILLSPQGEGIDLLAWVLPGLLFAAGFVLLLFSVWRWARAKEPAPGPGVTEDDRRMLERELERVEGEPGWS